MNRAFYIVVVPAVLVMAAYLAVFYGRVVPVPVAVVAVLVIAGAFVVRGLRRREQKPRPNSGQARSFHGQG